jgi:5'-nucleotidase
MSMMQYDASTIGNHDFDNGGRPTHNYRMLNLSFYLPTTILYVMDGQVKPYKFSIKTV